MSWLVHLRLGRVSNLPTVWTNVVAGAILAGAAFDLGTLLALLVALSLFYVGGMYLNDAFDRTIDARERPERPIPSGLISARAVFALGFGMLGAGIAMLAVAAMRGPSVWGAVAAGVVLAAAITYYDAVHKRDPLSPLVMGLCRVLVYFAAALAVAGALPATVLLGAAALLAYLIGLTYVAKQENLSEFRNAWPLLFLAAPFVSALPTLVDSLAGAVLYLLFLGWVAYSLSFLMRSRISIPGAVSRLIAGISLLDALLVMGVGAPRMAAGAAVAVVLTRVFQRYVAGT